jgi:hypothetical protein
MKRLLIMTAVVATFVSVAGFGMAVNAEESVTMTEEHIARIRDNCVDAQSTLFQLHASDAGLRVNRGQIYESISTKLMAPFNSRLILNRVNSDTLVKLGVEYEQQLQTFRLQYKQYEEAMSATLRMNCVNQPVAFYDSVVDTREKRRLTHEATVSLQKTIQKYGDEVEVFAGKFQAGTL